MPTGITVMLCGLINGWQAPGLTQPMPGIIQSTSIGRSMAGGDTEGPEGLWCEKGGRWAWVREGSTSPAWLCPPLLCQWVTPCDLMQDHEPVPVHGAGVLEAGPAAPALHRPKRDGKRLDRGHGNGWRCLLLCWKPVARRDRWCGLAPSSIGSAGGRCALEGAGCHPTVCPPLGCTARRHGHSADLKSLEVALGAP